MHYKVELLTTPLPLSERPKVIRNLEVRNILHQRIFDNNNKIKDKKVYEMKVSSQKHNNVLKRN